MLEQGESNIICKGGDIDLDSAMIVYAVDMGGI